MTYPSVKAQKQLAEIRDIAQAHERLAEIMGILTTWGRHYGTASRGLVGRVPLHG